MFATAAQELGDAVDHDPAIVRRGFLLVRLPAAVSSRASREPCRSCSASTRRRSRPRSKCATPTRARSSAKDARRIRRRTPPRSEQAPERVVGRVRAGPGAGCPAFDAIAVAGQQHGMVVSTPPARDPAGQAVERHRVGARRRLVAQASSTTTRGRTRAAPCRSPRSRSRKLSWLHRSEPDAWARVVARVLAARLAHVEADGRVRDRSRRRVGHGLLLGRDRARTGSTCSDRRSRRSTGRSRVPRVAAPDRSRRRDEARDRRARHGRQHGGRAGYRVSQTGDVAISLGTSGTVFAVSATPTLRRVGRRRGIRRRDRPLSSARVHVERDESDRRGRAACWVSISNSSTCSPSPRNRRRRRHHARAVLRRRAHAEPARRHRHALPACDRT